MYNVLLVDDCRADINGISSEALLRPAPARQPAISALSS